MIILDKAQITERVDLTRAAKAIEDAYRAASAGQVELPPVGHITFPDVGDCHIKYGHKRGDEVFVIKVATGFPANEATPVNNGLSLVLSAETGEVRAMLHDEMWLTDVRTGIGGAIASHTLARADARRLLIVGTGIQARHQLQSHRQLLDRPLEVEVWGRSEPRTAEFAAQFDDVRAVHDLSAACASADIIVTTTAARIALIGPDDIGPGTHITAVGADAPGKHELHPDLIARADVRVADSRSQCADHGEFSVIDAAAITAELGEVLVDSSHGRTNDDQITIADLTGIAAQDIAIASVVLE